MGGQYLFGSDSYYRARYYDPQIGRFINEDSTGFDGGSNFYRYVGNNPIDLVDRFGLSETKPCVDTKKLNNCLFKLYGVFLLSFSPTIGNGQNQPGNVNGSATVMIGWEPWQSVTITNDISQVWYNSKPGRSPYRNPGTGNTQGWTYSNDPYTNYTDAGYVGQAAMDIQIWELGNSLAVILNQMPTEIENPGKDPGGDLLRCYLKAVGREKDIY